MQTPTLPSHLTTFLGRAKPHIQAEVVDEIFAGLARRAFDPQPFRELATDLDRQHERLQSLLHDIDAATSD